MVEKTAIPAMLQRKVDRTLFKEAPLPELKGADLINSLVSSGILDAAQGEQIAKMFGEGGHEEIKKFVFLDLSKALSVTDSPSKLNLLREIHQKMIEIYADLQLRRAPELAEDGLGFKPENTDQLELENLYALFLFSIVEPAIAELEEKIEPVAERQTQLSGKERFDLKPSEEVISTADAKRQELDTKRGEILAKVRALDVFNPDAAKLDEIKVQFDSLKGRVVELNDLLGKAETERGYLTNVSGGGVDRDAYTKVQDLVNQVQKTLKEAEKFSNNLANLEDEVWNKRVLLDVPDIANLDSLYHPDSLDRSKLRYFVEPTVPEIAGLTNPLQRPIAQCLVFHRDLEAAIKTAERAAATLTEKRKQFVESTFITPARNHLVAVANVVELNWNRFHKQAFPELDEAIVGSFVSLLLRVETAAVSGFSDQSTADLQLEVSNIKLKWENLNAAINEFLAKIGIPQDNLVLSFASEFRSRKTALIEKIDGHAEKLSTKEGLIEVIRNNITQMMSRGYYDVIEYNNNQLTEDANRIRDQLDAARQKGASEVELEPLKYEYLRARFVVTKASIIKSLENYEFNDEGTGKVDEYNLKVLGPLKSDLRAVVDQVADATQHTQFKNEFDRFVHELDARVVFYISARSLKNDVLGITDSATSKDIAMQMPISIPIYLNNMSNELLGKLVAGRIRPCAEDSELRSPLEKELNPVIGRSVVEVYDPETITYVEKEIEITAWGQGMRHLDMFLEGRVPENLRGELKSRFLSKRREPHLMSGDDVYQIIYEFEVCRIASSRRININTAAGRAEAEREVRITKQDAVRAWNMSVMLMRPLELAPSSFNKPAPGYYALNPDYDIGEVIGSQSGATGKLSPLIYFGIIGPSFSHLESDENPDGVIYTLDAYADAYADANGHGTGGFIEKLGKSTHPKKIRERIRGAFDRKGFGHRYDFLIDLPLLPLSPSGSSLDGGREKDRFMVFTTPLSNMVVRKDGGVRSGEALRCPLPDGSQSDDRRIMVFTDLVDLRSVNASNPNGSLVYELMPFDKTLREDEEFNSWVGQGKNAMAFFESILFATPDEFAEGAIRKAESENNKLIKYATNILQPYAVMLREGLVDREKLKEQLLLTILFIQGILMLTLGKDINEVERKFSTYNVGGREGKEAVLVALRAGFSTSALARKFVTEFGAQVTNSLKLK